MYMYVVRVYYTIIHLLFIIQCAVLYLSESSDGD